MPPDVQVRLNAVLEELRDDDPDPSAYIPRDPVVSILLSFVTTGRPVCGALEAVRAAEHQHPFPGARAPSVTLADDVRIVLVGDWGSGIEPAQAVARHMRTRIEEAQSAGREVHVISLGDVYYSGLDFEYEERFLRYWPVSPSEARIFSSWALNGNHDMYSGGRAYFETLLGDYRFAGQKGSSYFMLENAHWQVAGLDTAYGPSDESGTHASLYGEQADWLGRHRDASKRTMLLTHHPLFSAFDPVGDTLLQQLGATLGKKPVDAWFWGHEHRCAVYRAPESILPFASLIGHGGIPMSPAAPHRCAAPVVYHQTAHRDGLTHCGFAVVDLNWRNAYVRYYDDTGLRHHDELA